MLTADHIRCYVSRGSKLQDIAEAAVKVAKEHKIPVCFEFNCLPIVLDHKDTAEAVVDRYHAYSLVRAGYEGDVQEYEPRQEKE